MPPPGELDIPPSTLSHSISYPLLIVSYPLLIDLPPRLPTAKYPELGSDHLVKFCINTPRCNRSRSVYKGGGDQGYEGEASRDL